LWCSAGKSNGNETSGEQRRKKLTSFFARGTIAAGGQSDEMVCNRPVRSAKGESGAGIVQNSQWRFRPMTASIALLALLLSAGGGSPISPTADELLQLARTDLRRFAETVTAGETTTRGRASKIVAWYATNLDWTATDYQRRTVDEILARRGGNCDELARVAVATMKALGIEMRTVREINLHVESDERQTRAEEKVRERGAAMSVFGRRHNDHVWLEIRDEDGSWFPADPSLGVVGEREWVQARLGFGERFTMDPTSADMIAPFAVFAAGPDGLLVSRTRRYVIDAFDETHESALSGLPSWKEWIDVIEGLEEKAKGALQGTFDLHQAEDEIRRAHDMYARLRAEFQAGR
jgi:hypothetical protein